MHLVAGSSLYVSKPVIRSPVHVVFRTSETLIALED